MGSMTKETKDMDQKTEPAYEYGVYSQGKPGRKAIVTWHDSKEDARMVVEFVNQFFGSNHPGETYLIRRPVATDDYERVED